MLSAQPIPRAAHLIPMRLSASRRTRAARRRASVASSPSSRCRRSTCISRWKHISSSISRSSRPVPQRRERRAEFRQPPHAPPPAYSSTQLTTELGNAAGWQVARVLPHRSGFQYEETASLGPTLQWTVVTFDSTGTVRNATQRGQAGGKEMRIDVRYDSTSLVGEVMTPLSDGALVGIRRELPQGRWTTTRCRPFSPTWTGPPLRRGDFRFSCRGRIRWRLGYFASRGRSGSPSPRVSSKPTGRSWGEGAPVVFWVAA